MLGKELIKEILDKNLTNSEVQVYDEDGDVLMGLGQVAGETRDTLEIEGDGDEVICVLTAETI